MGTLIGNPLIKAFFIIFLVSAATATATGDAPFIIAHKKASLNRLKSGAERVSVSVNIYNQGFTWEAYSTPILPLDILEERPPENKSHKLLTDFQINMNLRFMQRLMAKYGSQISVISIVVLFIYLIITPSKASKKKR
ncbi:hypothetical protein Gotur_032630 [Gossypium turneri]